MGENVPRGEEPVADTDAITFSQLDGSSEPGDWMRAFRDNFLFVGVVAGKLGQRMVVKIAYEERIKLDDDTVHINTNSLWGSNPNGRASYHFEAEAPDDVIIVRAELNALHGAEPPPTTPQGAEVENDVRSAPDGGDVGSTDADQPENERNSDDPSRPDEEIKMGGRARNLVAWEDHVDRVHLYVGPDNPTIASIPEATARHAYVDLVLSLRPSVVEPVLVSSLAVTFVYLFGVVFYLAGWRVDATNAGAAVIALPAVFAIYVAPSGHRLPRALLRQVQILAYASAVLSLAAAILVALAPPIHALWTIHGRFYGWSLVVLGVATFLAISQGYRSPAWMGLAVALSGAGFYVAAHPTVASGLVFTAHPHAILWGALTFLSLVVSAFVADEYRRARSATKRGSSDNDNVDPTLPPSADASEKPAGIPRTVRS